MNVKPGKLHSSADRYRLVAGVLAEGHTTNGGDRLSITPFSNQGAS